MDLFPLYNSIRIALISTAITFFVGLLAAYYAARAPRLAAGVLDVVFTLPLVLPPTVVGFFLLKLLGVNGAIGMLTIELFDTKLIMTWYASIFAGVIVAFPLMYRTARSAFSSFDINLKFAAQTLGRSNTYIFWRIILPVCKKGIIAGAVLAFARTLGEYGATSMVSGYTSGRTATISTTVYQLWRTGDDAGAYRWIAINIAISLVVLLALNMLEGQRKTKC